MEMFEKPEPAPANMFWPVFLLTITLVLWFSFQLTHILNEREAQLVVYSLQEAEVQTAGRLRNTLDALASGTYRMAVKGNVNAKQMMETLQRRGINIHAPRQ